MKQFIQELTIVRIKEDLGQGRYSARDVFTDESIIVKLSGKQRMNFRFSIGEFIYAVITNSDKENAWYVYTWRDPMRNDNKKTLVEEQRKDVDNQFINIFGIDEYKKLPK